VEQGHGPKRVSVPSEVMVQLLPDDEAVALNLATEQYFGFDSVGAQLWAALVEAGEVGAACRQLEAVFDVDPERLRRDVERFVGELMDRGLLLAGTD
jgi:hypothetical protein